MVLTGKESLAFLYATGVLIGLYKAGKINLKAFRIVEQIFREKFGCVIDTEL